MIKFILFDLDGTLLPMEQDKFIQIYLGLLAKKANSYGYDPDRLVKTIWAGTSNMVLNDGKMTNEDVFWNTFVSEYGIEVLKDKYIFDNYYYNEFQQLKGACGFNKESKLVVDKLKNLGYKLVLATNPLFPAIATESRIRWAGLDPNDFQLYTTYENSHHCKPNLEYYNDILEKLECDAHECLMVGNDVDEDMIVAKIGMKTFLLTDCLINKNNVSIKNFTKGSFKDLLIYIDSLNEK